MIITYTTVQSFFHVLEALFSPDNSDEIFRSMNFKRIEKKVESIFGNKKITQEDESRAIIPARSKCSKRGEFQLIQTCRK